ncbi:MAG: hypothetical protein ACW97X_12385, partial [Candidatus Hodarchaeales archaeon]
GGNERILFSNESKLTIVNILSSTFFVTYVMNKMYLKRKNTIHSYNTLVANKGNSRVKAEEQLRRNQLFVYSLLI